MAETYRLSPRVKLLWFVPYISGIILLWLIATALYFTVLSDKTLLWITPDTPKIEGTLSLLLMAFIIIGLPGFLWIELYFRSYTYTLADKDMSVKSGIFKVNRVNIPYDSIENVSVKKTLATQIIGIGNVVIDTAGGDAAEGFIPGVVDADGLMNAITKHITEIRGTGEVEKIENTNVLLKEIKAELVEIKDVLKKTAQTSEKKGSEGEEETEEEHEEEKRAPVFSVSTTPVYVSHTTTVVPEGAAKKGKKAVKKKTAKKDEKKGKKWYEEEESHEDIFKRRMEKEKD